MADAKVQKVWSESSAEDREVGGVARMPSDAKSERRWGRGCERGKQRCGKTGACVPNPARPLRSACAGGPEPLQVMG